MSPRMIRMQSEVSVTSDILTLWCFKIDGYENREFEFADIDRVENKDASKASTALLVGVGLAIVVGLVVWSTSDYEFSNYEAIYNVARIISPTQYRYDVDLNAIVVNDNEVIDSISQTRDTNYKVILKVVYEYIDRKEGSLSELEQYYTPYVNGYAISMIDKDNIV